MTDWRNWIITDEQAVKITNKDKEAIDKFYFDNLERIRKTAYNYKKHNLRCADLFEDMLQNVYLDLYDFKQANGIAVSDGISLSRFMYNSFVYTPYGGMYYLRRNNPKLLCGGSLDIYTCDTLSLDCPNSIGNNRHQDDDGDNTLLNIFGVTDVYFENDDEYGAGIKSLVADLLTARQREYFDYYIDGYGSKDISQKMGYKSESNNANIVKQRLRKNVDKILQRLKENGYNVDRFIGVAPYNPKTDKVYKLSPEKRAQYAENMRQQRARKKAQAAGLSF